MPTLQLGDMAGTEMLSGAIAQDRQFYEENFLQPSLRLREIGLGMGMGNQYTAASTALDRSGRNFASAERAYARDVERSGVAGDPTQQASRARRMSLGRIIAQVDAANRASRGAQAAQREAATAGTQFYGDLIGDANATLRGIAEAETQRDAQYRQARSSANSSGAGLAGAAIAAFI